MQCSGHGDPLYSNESVERLFIASTVWLFNELQTRNINHIYTDTDSRSIEKLILAE
jgi:hypothetical protein